MRPGSGRPNDYPGDPLDTVKSQATEWTDSTHTVLRATWIAEDGLEADSVWVVYLAGSIVARLVAAYTYDFTVPTPGIVPNIAVVAVRAECDPASDYDPLGGGENDSNIYPVRELTVVSGSGSGTYKEGTVVDIGAYAVAEQVFDHWTGTVSDPSSAVTTWTAGFADETVTANYIAALSTVGVRFYVNEHDPRTWRRAIQQMTTKFANIPSLTSVQNWATQNFVKLTRVLVGDVTGPVTATVVSANIPRAFAYPTTKPTLPLVYPVFYKDSDKSLQYASANSTEWTVISTVGD